MVVETRRRLDQPVVDDGIRWLNFFNGRVLSAEDLRTDHAAIREARRQLGRGMGAGVVTGFDVAEAVLGSSAGSPVLSVTAGLAFNEDGQALELRRDVTIGLVRVDAPTGGEGATFTDCDVVLPGTAGLGAYVLTVGPAEVDVGKAVVAGLGNQPADCNTAFSVEGVRFRLFPVPLDEGDDDEPDLLRNRLAYRMFGVLATERSRTAVDAFGRTARSTLLDQMTTACFGPTDVPIALLHWEPGEGIRFVDAWSVRRRVARSRDRSSWGEAIGDHLAAATEAAVLQFQHHLRDVLRFATGGAIVRARDHFAYLPPVGLLPLRSAGRPNGIDQGRFFEGVKVRGPFFVEGAKVDPTLRAAQAFHPIELASQELIWLYEGRQNAQATADDDGSLVPFLLFTTGFVPYRGNAQFDLARWDFANYALRVT